MLTQVRVLSLPRMIRMEGKYVLANDFPICPQKKYIDPFIQIFLVSQRQRKVMIYVYYYSCKQRQILDDFREAYFWLWQNTDENARIMSWWDYGYQIAGMGNRTTLVDNNTWNNSHIALVRSLTSFYEIVYIILPWF